MSASRPIWNASNILSMMRIVFLIPIVYLLWRGASEPNYNLYAVVVMFFAGLTDTFDGWLARKLNQITDFGKVIDPIADKIAFVVILGFLSLTRPEFPVWFFLLALVRDVAIFTLGWFAKKKYGILFVSNLLGKTFVTIVAFMTLVFIVKDLFGLGLLYEILLYTSLALLLASSLSYAVKFVRFLGQRRPA